MHSPRPALARARLATFPVAVPSITVLTVTLALVALAGVGRLWVQNQALQAELSALRRVEAAASARERELTAAVAAQHRDLRENEAALWQVRTEIQAVELQLDGVDRLSNQIRDALGLPPGEGTWGAEAIAGPPQGGALENTAIDGARVAHARQRLSYGLAELTELLEAARQKSAAAEDVAAAPPAPLARLEPEPPLNWPLRGSVTSDYGWRIFRDRPNYHTGIDVSAPIGTQVQSTGAGTVVGSGWQPGFGWSVLVQHPGGYSSLYGHLSALLVEVGDRVEVGTAIGRSGSSGNSTGPHLHYEIWHNGLLQDPRPYMDGHGPG